MGIPLFVSERSRPQMTTRPLSVGCLIFEQIDQIDLADEAYYLSGLSAAGSSDEHSAS